MEEKRKDKTIEDLKEYKKEFINISSKYVESIETINKRYQRIIIIQFIIFIVGTIILSLGFMFISRDNINKNININENQTFRQYKQKE